MTHGPVLGQFMLELIKERDELRKGAVPVSALRVLLKKHESITPEWLALELAALCDAAEGKP